MAAIEHMADVPLEKAKAQTVARRTIARLRKHWPRFERSELIFAALAIGLACVVGFVGPPGDVQWYICIVVWSGLVGMMIPRIIDARRADPEATDPAGLDTPAVRHDVASALLTIEGGVCALRYMNQTNVPEVESVTHAIETEVRRIRRLSLSKSATAAQQPLPECVAAEAIEPLVSLHRASGMAIDCDIPPDSRVRLDRDDLARVVGNILDNCVQHAPGATMTIRAVEISGQVLRLTMADDGPGIAAEVGATALQAGVSTQNGGLGLHSVQNIVEAHGGSVMLDLDANGTTVHMDLPLVLTGSLGPGAPAVLKEDAETAA